MNGLISFSCSPHQYYLLRIRHFLLLFLAFFPLMPYQILSITTALFCCLSILLGYEIERVNGKNIVSFFKVTGYFFLICLSVLYSDNISEASSILLRLSPLLCFPIISFFSPLEINNDTLNKIKRNFVCSIFIILSIIFFYAYQELKIVGYDKLFYWSTLARATKSVEFLDFHPNYVALYISLCVYIIIEIKHLNKYLKILIIPILVVIVVLLSARAVLAGLFVSFCFYLTFYYKKNFKIKLFLISSILIVFIVLVKKTNHVFTSFDFKVLLSKNVEIKSQTPNSSEIRLVTLHCLSKILQNNYLFGLGIGDLKKELNDCYVSTNNVFMSEQNINTHNNYLFFFGSAGIFCVSLFLLGLYFLFKEAYSSSNIVLLLFLITIFIVLFFENILSRAYGITFFAYFQFVFTLNSRKAQR